MRSLGWIERFKPTGSIFGSTRVPETVKELRIRGQDSDVCVRLIWLSDLGWFLVARMHLTALPLPLVVSAVFLFVCISALFLLLVQCLHFRANRQ